VIRFKALLKSLLKTNPNILKLRLRDLSKDLRQIPELQFDFYIERENKIDLQITSCYEQDLEIHNSEISQQELVVLFIYFNNTLGNHKSNHEMFLNSSLKDKYKLYQATKNGNSKIYSRLYYKRDFENLKRAIDRSLTEIFYYNSKTLITVRYVKHE